jgi:hypothetical protein
MTRGSLAAVIAVIAGLTGGCESRKSAPSGLGPYRFGHTTRAQLKSGVCQPTELTDGRKATWCFALPPIKVGERTADVDAYFLGTDPPLLGENPTEEQRTARKAELAKLPLIELQLKIRGCVETEVEQWMRQRYGGADADSKGVKTFWHNDFLWAMAVLPSEPGRCIVHFLPVSETAEIARLKAK